MTRCPSSGASRSTYAWRIRVASPARSPPHHAQKLRLFFKSVETHPLHLRPDLFQRHIGLMPLVSRYHAPVPAGGFSLTTLNISFSSRNLEEPFFPETEEVIGILKTYPVKTPSFFKTCPRAS